MLVPLCFVFSCLNYPLCSGFVFMFSLVCVAFELEFLHNRVVVKSPDAQTAGECVRKREQDESQARDLQYAGLGDGDAVTLELLAQLPVVLQLALEARLRRHG